ncbi:LysR family transcriptional regulator [Verrucomicrobiota bacterium sgz303538]
MEWLNYHHLRYFWMVAREGSLRRAAERLSISQPSISAQIRLLEDALGEKLFRRSGRGLQLTDAGRLVYGYAEEIFTLGRELVGALKGAGSDRPMRVNCGIVDSVPKVVAYSVLRPALEAQPPSYLVCREGKLDELLAQLASHRLDMILADEPAPSGLRFKVFNHPLGATGITICARGSTVAKLRRNFPHSLSGAPALLPTENTAMRMALERWFSAEGIEPKVIAEFEDAALLKVAAADSDAFFPVHSVAAQEAVERYDCKVIAEVPECRSSFYAITAERRLKHPAVVALTEYAHTKLFT